MTAVASFTSPATGKSGPHAWVWITMTIAFLFTGCAAPRDVDDLLSISAAPPAEFMLTFDDGPIPGRTDRVLDMLATLKAVDGTPVRAGFFLLGDAPDTFWQRRRHYAPYEVWGHKGSIADYPGLARRIQADGHIIGNHSTHHVWLHWPWQRSQKAIAAELAQWEAIATPVLGEQDVQLFRPPYLVLTKNLRAVAQQLNYQIVMGTSTGDTTPFLTPAMITAKIAALLRNWDKPYPCVLVFHGMRPATYEHLDEIVVNLQQQGFRLVHFDPERL